MMIDQAKYDALLAVVRKCADALDRAEDYFEQRQDCEILMSGTHPNEEMQILLEVEQAQQATKPFISEGA